LTKRYHHIQAAKAESHVLDRGERTSILATALETDGRVSIFDSFLPAGNEAPWHYHEVDDEIFYIVSGEVEFGVDEEEFVAVPGDLVIAGPYVPRRFKALADSRFLVVNAPGGPSEGFIRDIAQFKDGKIPSEEDKRRFVELYKIHVL
jgi:quercetin dioxygenase-like cupin family protein